MNGWIIVLIVLAVLWLLSLIRLGGIIHYGPDNLRITAIAGPIRIKVLPAREVSSKPKKKRKEKKPKKEKEKEEPKGDRPGTPARLMKLLPVVVEAAGALRRKIRIDRLSLGITWGAPDAAAAALGFGRANALLGMIWPLFDHNFDVKKHSFCVDVDYELEHPIIIVDAALTMTIGQLVAFAVHYGVKALVNWSRSGKRSERQQEA